MALQKPFLDFDQLLAHARGCSHYLARLLDSEPTLQSWLQDHYRTPCDAAFILHCLDTFPAETEDQLSTAVRSLRKRVMLHLIMRDLGGLCDLSEVMRAMTTLAELTVRRAHSFTMQNLVTQFGQPIGAESGTPQELLVIGMGKLGGGELNVSSDIDLIFTYPEDGETNGART